MKNNLDSEQKTTQSPGGAPLGNRNAQKHGCFTKANHDLYQQVIALLREHRASLADFHRQSLA